MEKRYIASKKKAENAVKTDSNSPEEYADEKIERGIDEIIHDGAYLFDKEGRKGLKDTKKNYYRYDDKTIKTNITVNIGARLCRWVFFVYKLFGTHADEG